MASNKSILQQNLLKLLLALFFLFSSFIYSQTIGDYRSIASGNWTNVNIWQYYNGTTWVAATYYPGQTGGPTVNQVSIQGGFSVTLTSNIPGHINSVIVGDGIGGTDTLFISAHTSVNTDVMIISSGGVIDWTANVILSLPSGSAFIVDGGYMDESNPCDAAKKLVIGGNTYSSCNGHGNGSDKPFSFNDLNDGGGSINVSPSSNGPICEGTVLNLYANPSGAGSTDSSNTYSWSGTGPSGYSFSSNLQNPVVLNLLAGSYTYTVTVVHSGTFTHSNSVSVEVYSAPVADAPADIDACESYVLPSLSMGNYYTGSGGTGVTLNAGDQITSTQTIYVFAQSGTTPNCTDENSFLITIEPAPAEPTDLECWETATFNDATCSWDVSGTQPAEPTDLECWETATFNDATCSWDVSGTQPAEPTDLECWETATFNDATCSWDVSGTQPAEPTDLECWETATFNDATCSWDVSGTQPAEPTDLECWRLRPSTMRPVAGMSAAHSQPSLRTLNAGRLRPSTMRPVAGMSAAHSQPSLRTLNAGRLRPSTMRPVAGMSAAHSQPSLRTLNAGRLRPSTMRPVAGMSAAHSQPSLRTLNAGRLRPSTMRPVAGMSAAHSQPSLRTLNAGRLRPSTMRPVAGMSAAHSQPSLRTLNAGDCDLQRCDL